MPVQCAWTTLRGEGRRRGQTTTTRAEAPAVTREVVARRRRQASGDEATSSGGEDDETGDGGAVAMDEGENGVDMEREDSGGEGADSSSERLAVREVGVDVETAVEANPGIWGAFWRLTM